MTTRNVQISLKPNAASVLVDGAEIANGVRSLSFHAAAGILPTVELEILSHELSVDGEMRLVLHPKSHDVLQALGWTPPGATTDPEAMREAASRLLTAANEAEAGR